MHVRPSASASLKCICLGSLGLVMSCGGMTTTPQPVVSTLVSVDFSLAPGEEHPGQCSVLTIDHDVYMDKIIPVTPAGFHHVLVALNTSQVKGPDFCKPENAMQQALITPFFVFGIGTKELVLPKGSAMKLPANTELVVIAHVLNPTQTTLTGTIRVDAEVVDKATVEESDSFGMFAFPFQIPANTEQFTVRKSCPVRKDTKIFAIWPHMHNAGQSYKVWMTSGGVDTTLSEGTFHLMEQEIVQIATTNIHAGDRLTYDCVYTNPSSTPIDAGFAFANEMCVMITYNVPALNQITTTDPECTTMTF